MIEGMEARQRQRRANIPTIMICNFVDIFITLNYIICKLIKLQVNDYENATFARYVV